MEVKFHTWEWEEQVDKLSLEQVGLGKGRVYSKTSLKWLTVAMPLLDFSKRLETQKTSKRLVGDKRWSYG